MSRNTKWGFACAIIMAMGLVPAALAHDESRALAATAYVPTDLPIVIRLNEPDEQLGRLRAYLADTGLLDSEARKLIASNPQLAAARVGLLGLAAAAEMDAWTAVRALLGRELVIAIEPRAGEQPRVLAISIARDVEALDRFLEQVHLTIGVIKGGKLDRERTQEHAGATIIKLNESFFECRHEGALIVANDAELIRRAIDAAADEDSITGVLAADADADSGAIAQARFDLRALREITGPRGFFADRLENALAAFLLGGWSHAAREADHLSATLFAKDGALRLVLEMHSEGPLAAVHHAFLNDQKDASGWAVETIPAYLAELRVARDWHALFADREAILTLPAASGVVNFSTILSTLLGEVDFIDGFLARINGPLRFVIAAQDFSGLTYEPTPKLPAMALIVPLGFASDPELADTLDSAALRTITVMGLDQSQKNQPSLMTRTERYQDTNIVYGEYRAPRNENENQPNLVPVQFNFRPAIARIGDALVISTTRELMHHIIDASRGKPVPLAADRLHIDAAALAKVLRDNLEELIANRMIKESETREEAEQFHQALFAILERVDAVVMTSEGSRAGFEGSIEVKLNE